VRVGGRKRIGRGVGAQLAHIGEDGGQLLLRALVLRAAGDAQPLGGHANERLIECGHEA
jgi:hypothetical protein